MTHEELKNIREANNLTKSAFAKLIGITAMLQGRYESGRISIPAKVEEAVKKVFAGEKAVDTVPVTEEQPKKKSTRGRKKKSPTLYIQSLLGGTISTDEVLSRVMDIAPDAEEIYVKAEENKAYWVSKDGGGEVDLWG